MKTTRAKFKVMLKSPYSYQGGEIAMAPVYSTDPAHENRAFWDATPNGEIKLRINNQAAFDNFEQGAEYYVDFTKAE